MGGSTVLALPLGFSSSSRAAAANGSIVAARDRSSLSIDSHQVRIVSPAVTSALKIMVVADTHLFRDDARGEPYRPYSARMAKAYNETRHFQTQAPTNPEEAFVAALRLAREARIDLLVLAGDLFSFPSEAAVEWVRSQLAEAGLPYLYVAGNHDWHYEGMPGTLNELRTTWIEKRLRPLYQERHPLMTAQELKGIRIILLDDSTYEIQPEQLDFFRAQVATGQPLALFLHIPLYAPGRGVGFGCGHPEWGAKTDRNFELERRPRWPATGHTEVTRTFHREVFATPNLLGIFAGHTHRPSMDVVKGLPQFVADANATGAHLSVEFLPSLS